MPNANTASTRSKTFAGYQVSFEVPRLSIEEVAIQVLEEPALEEELTPLDGFGEISPLHDPRSSI